MAKLNTNGMNFKYLPLNMERSIKLKADFNNGSLNVSSLINNIVGVGFKKIPYNPSGGHLNAIPVPSFTNSTPMAELNMSPLYNEVNRLLSDGLITKDVFEKLRCGFRGEEEFLDYFPYARICLYGGKYTKEENGVINGCYDPDRLLGIQKNLNKLLPIWDNPIPLFERNLVPAFGYDGEEVSSGDLLHTSDTNIQLIQSVMVNVSYDDMVYYTYWTPIIGTFQGDMDMSVTATSTESSDGSSYIILSNTEYNGSEVLGTISLPKPPLVASGGKLYHYK